MLQAEEARQWAQVWRQQVSQMRRCMAPRSAAGERSRRRGPGAAVRTARRVLGRRRAHVTVVQGPDGAPIDDPAEVERLLWASREHIWGSAADVSEAAGPLLRTYFDGRAQIRAAGAPCWEQLIGFALKPTGSAAGTDGVPYELYQWSPQRDRMHCRPSSVGWGAQCMGDQTCHRPRG